MLTHALIVVCLFVFQILQWSEKPLENKSFEPVESQRFYALPLEIQHLTSPGEKMETKFRCPLPGMMQNLKSFKTQKFLYTGLTFIHLTLKFGNVISPKKITEISSLSVK